MNSRGQVYPLFLLMLVALIGLSALSVDVGYYRYQQRVQQSATDAAALAAAQEYQRSGGSTTDMQDAMWSDANTNGFATPAATVSADPSYSSSYTTGSTAVEVKITKAYPKFFGAIYGSGTRSIMTRSVAALLSQPGACIMTLGSSPQSSVHSTVGTSCAIVTTGCPKVTGTIDVQAFTYSTSGCDTSSATFTDGQPQHSLPPQNPCNTIPACSHLALYTPPPAASCTGSISTANLNLTQGGCYNSVGKVSGCSGKGSASSFILQGFFVFEGSGIDFNGCSVTSGASGVTIYLAGSATFNVGGSVMTLSAPAANAGDYVAYTNGEAGILFYGTSSNNNVTTANGTTINSTGLWYFPNSDVTLNGASGTTFTGGLIVNSYTDNGNTRFIDPSTTTTGGETQVPTIVE